ncbi:MAG TPA: aldo/keto reductase [Candidatus Faecousia faecigallinarum]|nr:aldo/keto reductase [Candidatus Faecousia faecigallinarum]
MEYITLKNSNLQVSRLCMGGCPMGGYGWGKVEEKELLAAIGSAMEHGVNFFDTADTYGLGQSERTLAKGLGPHRKDVVIETKFGVRAGGGKTVYDNSPAYIQTALEASLRRLNTDYIDIYLIHYRDGKTPIAEVTGKLEQLKAQGKIRYYGLSNIHADGLAEMLPYAGKFVCCQNEFSLACRKNENDLQAVQNRLDLTPMTWGSLGQGILTGKYDEHTVFGADDRRSRDVYVNFHGEKLAKNLGIVRVLRNIAQHRGKTIAACAIRWILDTLPESVVIAGVKRPAQLEANVEAMDWHLDEEELRELDEVSK